MTPEPDFAFFHTLQNKCVGLFDEGHIEEGIKIFDEACKKISHHVERPKLVTLQKEFVDRLVREHRPDVAVTAVRQYMYDDARAAKEQKKCAPRHRTTRASDDVEGTKSPPPTPYSEEFNRIDQNSQANLFGNLESNPDSFGDRPGINRTASEPVPEHHEVESGQLMWKQRPQTAPGVMGGLPLGKDHDRPSGLRHAVRRMTPWWHHEEKDKVDEGGGSKV